MTIQPPMGMSDEAYQRMLAIDASARALLADPNNRCDNHSCPCNGGPADTGAARHVHVCPPDDWCGCE